MRKINILFSEYTKSHRNPTNKLIHWVCVPLIFCAILGLISLIPAPHFCFIKFGCISIISCFAVFIVSLYYIRLSFVMGFFMLLLMVLVEYFLYLINISFPKKSWLIYIAVFVISWVFQFIGHKIEGKKPSFLKDLQFLLVGPIWLLGAVLRKLNIRY